MLAWHLGCLLEVHDHEFTLGQVNVVKNVNVGTDKAENVIFPNKYNEVTEDKRVKGKCKEAMIFG